MSVYPKKIAHETELKGNKLQDIFTCNFVCENLQQCWDWVYFRHSETHKMEKKHSLEEDGRIGKRQPARKRIKISSFRRLFFSSSSEWREKKENKEG